MSVIAFCSKDPYWIVIETNSETTFRPLTLHIPQTQIRNQQAVTKPLINQGTHVSQNRPPLLPQPQPQPQPQEPLPSTACTYCGKEHPGLTHPDANQNTVMVSVIGRAIIRLKGPEATLDIRNRYDTVIKRLVPLDAETLTNLRKTLPPPKPSTKYTPGRLS